MNFSSYPTNELINKHKLNEPPHNIKFVHHGVGVQELLMEIFDNILTRIEALEQRNVEIDRQLANLSGREG